MLHPIIANENGKTRYDEMLKTAEQHRQANKFNSGWNFSLPKVSNLFTGRKSAQKTAASAS